MAKKEIEFKTAKEAIDHVEKGAKDKGKASKPRVKKSLPTSGTEIKAVNAVANNDYRHNYSEIFGHD